MNPRPAAIALAAVLTLGLTACGSGADENAGGESPYLYERTITLTDGRTITCVVYANAKQGGVSCDWSDR